MFRHGNPGLSPRFPIEHPFRFENFTIEQLEQVLQSMLEDQDPISIDEAFAVARGICEALPKLISTNAGVVDSALEMAIKNYKRKVSARPFNANGPKPQLQPVDFDPHLSKSSQVDFQKMKGQVQKSIIEQLDYYQRQWWNAKERGGVDPKDLDLIPTRFVFHGPPGTGKTTAANMMAELFCSIGYISTPRIVEYFPADLIGQYVGRTRHQTREKLTETVGRLLFIDDIGDLLNNTYENEAMDELKMFLSEPAYRSNTIVILAGNKKNIDDLMRRPDMSSIFMKEIVFENIQPDDCVALLRRDFQHRGLAAETNFLENRLSSDYEEIRNLFGDIQSVGGWSNARDVKHIASEAMSKLYELDGCQTGGTYLPTIIAACIVRKIVERKVRYTETDSFNYPPPKGVDPDTWAEMQKLAHSQAHSRRRPPPQAAISTASDTKSMTRHPTDTDSYNGHHRNGSLEASSKPQAVRTSVEIKGPEIHRQKLQGMEDRATPVERGEGTSDADWSVLQKRKKIQPQHHAELKGEIKGLERALQEAGDRLVRSEGEELEKLEADCEKAGAKLMAKKKLLNELVKEEERIQARALREWILLDARWWGIRK
ncbi:P-loop containing nucleoside triphosphate hydrolase protein [Hypomontagnella monticulosa]|nr:P-loop containing nucleoside triphosphate hydrolase protein [Hypomontagnella monticulosa]